MSLELEDLYYCALIPYLLFSFEWSTILSMKLFCHSPRCFRLHVCPWLQSRIESPRPHFGVLPFLVSTASRVLHSSVSCQSFFLSPMRSTTIVAVTDSISKGPSVTGISLCFPSYSPRNSFLTSMNLRGTMASFGCWNLLPKYCLNFWWNFAILSPTYCINCASNCCHLQRYSVAVIGCLCCLVVDSTSSWGGLHNIS